MTNYRFYTISSLMNGAFDNGDIAKAEELSHEYLGLAEENKTDWNYGNAIHNTHIVFGRIALLRNDMLSAIHHLKKAGQTPGSPQLISFGPNMVLALELLELGYKKEVIDYINSTKNFWLPQFSRKKIKLWVKAIREGSIPHFGPHLKY